MRRMKSAGRIKRIAENPLNFWCRAVSRRHKEREVLSAFDRVLMR